MHRHHAGRNSGRAPVRAAPLAAILLLAATTAAARTPCSGDLSGSGDATYYDYTPGTGNCSFADTAADTLVTAVSDTVYDNAAMCGRWLRVTGPAGSVDVRVVDRCPTCPAENLDLSLEAFRQIGDPLQGIIPVTWQTIASPDTAHVTVYSAPETNPWYVRLLVDHHRYGLASLEYLADTGYVDVPRTSDNHFVIDSNLGVTLPVAATITVRLTDTNGQALVVAGVSASPDTVTDTGQQFPVCTSSTGAGPLPAAAGLVLHEATPNPFNPSTTIAFDLPRRETVRLRVFDATGRLVAVLLDGAELPRGRNEAIWDGRDLAGRSAPSGVYMCRLEAGGLHVTRKLALLK